MPLMIAKQRFSIETKDKCGRESMGMERKDSPCVCAAFRESQRPRVRRWEGDGDDNVDEGCEVELL